MAFTPHPLLDLAVPMVGASFRFDLLDRDRERQGTLAVMDDATPSIEHNVDRSVKRTLSGLRLSPTESADLNPLSDLVQPIMTTADGIDWPLGVFLFTDFPGKRTSVGVTRDASLQDGGALLEAGIPRTIGLAAGASVRAAVVAYLEEAGVSAYVVPAFGNVVGSPKSWKPGTPWRTVINDLLDPSGFYSPSFDHRGVCQIMTPPSADDAGQAATCVDGSDGESSSRIVEGSIVEDDTTLTAANRYLCIDTTATAAPVVGVYDVPAAAPWSIANRGLVITEQVEAQGLATVAEAVAAAKMAYLRSRRTASASFSTPPDPRHDLWVVVAYRDAAWRESKWAMSCKPGGNMTHEVRRTYT